jgi:hypothetical protein
MSTVFQETIRYAVVSARAFVMGITVLFFAILWHADSNFSSNATRLE